MALANDFNILGSQLVCFSDTKFEQDAEIELNSDLNVLDSEKFTKSCFFSNSNRPSLGLAAYSKTDMDCAPVNVENDKGEQVGSVMLITLSNFVNNNEICMLFFVTFCQNVLFLLLLIFPLVYLIISEIKKISIA